MKEFNLEEALAGKPVQTRDGRPVRIVQFYNEEKKLLIIAFVKEFDDREISATYTEYGLFKKEEKDLTDLIMV